MSARSLFATSAAIALGVGLHSPALAQVAPGVEAQTERDVIVVTAQTREQTLIEVPINIAVADQAQLDLLGTDDIEEYADFVPGLEVQAQSLNTSSYSLRGVTSDGGRPRVAVFENGVAIGNPRYGANTAMFDLERVEVVKGPQATLFGQGALVGGINFIQNKASLRGNEGWARIDAGEYEYIRAEAGYNVVLTDTLALRVAGLVKNRAGYVPNIANSPDLMGQDTTALRAALAWEPTDTLRADLIVNHQRDDSTGTQFKSGVFAPTGGDVSPFTPTANNITPDQLRDRLGADRELFSATLDVSWELNDAWTLTSITNARYLENLEAFDSDGAEFSLLQFATIDNAQTWSQELRLNYDAGGPMTAFFGANYYTQDASNLLRLSTDERRAQAFLAPQIAAGAGLTVPVVKQLLTLLGGVPAADADRLDNLLNPLPFSAALLLLEGRLVPLHGRHVEETFSNGEQTNYDFFGDVSFDVTDRLTVTGGLRYTQDDLYSDALVYLVSGNPALGGVRNAVTGGTTLVSDDDLGVPRARSFEPDGELTWRFNAAYRFTDDLNGWVAVGRGRRPPSLSSRVCTAGVDANCDVATANSGFEVVSQEIYDNIEVGASGMFLDGRMQATTSAYYGQYTDFQTTRYDVNQGTFISENSGNATSWGVEFDSRIEATDYLNLLASYAYASAKYDDEDSDGNPLQLAGNTFRLSPANTFSIAADLHWPVNAMGGEVYFAPSYVWKDEQFFEDDNDANEFQDAYGILDLKLGFDHDSGVWGASVYVENVLDEEYLIDGGNTGGEFGIPTYIRGLPRMAGAGAYLKF